MISGLKKLALSEAAELPPGVFDEYREAINSCDTIEEVELLRENIKKEKKHERSGNQV